jgi:hypothetical protein
MRDGYAGVEVHGRLQFTTNSIIAVLIALAACGGKNDEKPLNAAVFGKTIAPPGELGKLRVGMTVEEARRLAPGLVPKSGRRDGSGVAGMKFEVGLDLDRTRIDRIALDLPPTSEDLLVAAWGPGIAAANRYWLDPTTRQRAEGIQQGSRYLVNFEPYTPLPELFGKAAGTFRFETTPALGATVEQLRAAYPGLGEEESTSYTRYYLPMLPAEIARTGTYAYFDHEHGRVTRISIDLDHLGHAPGRAATIAAADAAWGKGEDVDAAGGQRRVWFDTAGNRRAELVGRIDSQTTFEVHGFTPLATLLGEGGDRFGFETTPLLGKTWDEIRAAYPDRVVAAVASNDYDEAVGDLVRIQSGGTGFVLPPTEWAWHATAVFFHLDAAGKVDRYVLQIRYPANAAAKDAIRTALQAKFGVTGPVERGEYGREEIVLRAAGPRIVARHKGLAWNVEVGALPEE